MKKVTIYQAKTNLSKLIQEALGGEEIIIAKGKKALVKLQVLDQKDGARRIGSMKGKIVMSDDFDDELTDFADYVS